MRWLPLFLLLSAFMPCVVIAEDGIQNDPQPSNRSAAVQSYIVQLTEVRMSGSLEPGLSAHDVLQAFEKLKKEGKMEMIETVQLSALEQTECMAQFSRSIPVIVGMSFAGPGRTTQNTQYIEVGTVARVTARPQGEKVLLELLYEASRLERQGQEDTPPATVTVNFQTSLLIEPGHPTLVGGTTSSTTTSLLMVSVEK